METPNLFDYAEALQQKRIADAEFDGKTFVAEWDAKRLTGQWKRVFEVMASGAWRTLSEIQDEIWRRFQKHDSTPGISARLRDFRKERFGSHEVLRQRRGEAERGLHEYRLAIKR